MKMSYRAYLHCYTFLLHFNLISISYCPHARALTDINDTAGKSSCRATVEATARDCSRATDFPEVMLCRLMAKLCSAITGLLYS